MACGPLEPCHSCLLRDASHKSEIGRVGRLQFVVAGAKADHKNMHFSVKRGRDQSTLSLPVTRIEDDSSEVRSADVDSNQWSLAEFVSSVFNADFTSLGCRSDGLVAVTDSSVIIRAMADWFVGAMAFKFFHPALLESRFAQKIFMHEAHAMTKVNHSGIAPLFHYGITSSGIPFLINQFVPGASLSELNKLQVQVEPVSLFIQVCESIAFAHSQNILHGRLSAGKIIVSSDLRSDIVKAKVIDFSVCAALRLQLPFDFSSLRSSASPEERYGQDPDFRSDVYSLGHIMYETLTGSQPAFNRAGKAIGFAGLRGVPQLMEPLVVRCLAHEPGDRYQTAQELLNELLVVESKVL